MPQCKIENCNWVFLVMEDNGDLEENTLKYCLNQKWILQTERTSVAWMNLVQDNKGRATINKISKLKIGKKLQ